MAIRNQSAWGAVVFLMSVLPALPAAGQPAKPAQPPVLDFESVRLAVEDLTATFGPRYPEGKGFLTRIDALRRAAKGAAFKKRQQLAAQLAALRDEALLANPLLGFKELLLVKRKPPKLGLPVNHKCNSGIEQTGYDNEIAALSPVRPGGRLRTVYRPKGGEYVGEVDLHYDARRLLFTMPRSGSWRIFEMRLGEAGKGGGRPRELSGADRPDVDNFDGCYLPDGRIVFASTASVTAVPCWHGKERACSLYLMDGNGGGVRQLCFDQDLDLHPAVLPTGQIIFSRWDYTGPMHMYLRPLMVMNPDGTAQRAAYGSNSYWPNALYYPRGIPGCPDKIVAIVAGYHGPPRMGDLAVIDMGKAWREAEGIVQRIPGRGRPIETVIRDNLTQKSWPKFLQPYPLTDRSAPAAAGKYFLVAAQLAPKKPWGIYVVDVFDNIVPLLVQPGWNLFEPIPLRESPRPPAIPDRVDLKADDAAVYLQDVYAGPGLAGVPRGTVKRLRIAAYHFGYPGLAGPDKIGCGGPWEVMRILGSVPVQPDGSAVFRIPAKTPLTIQPLDEEGKAVQLMRSWFAAMPGEVVSCVGCHESPGEAATVRRNLAERVPSEIKPFYGPARGWDFERDVQPVLDRYCVGCHNAEPREDGRKIPDLRSEQLVEGYRGRPLTNLGATRLHPKVREHLGGESMRYTPAYEALLPYIRRVNIEDDVHLLTPGEYHADTSELIQMLAKGHQGVKLDREAQDRLVTWIDLNGPCHGSWGDACPVPEGADRRRRELAELYGGADADPEAVPKQAARGPIEPVIPKQVNEPAVVPAVAGWPFDAAEARRRQTAGGACTKTVDLGGGVTMGLVWAPRGKFVMGGADPAAAADERPLTAVSVEEGFWIGATEITNGQLQRFDPSHKSGLFTKRYEGMDGPGLWLTGPRQPAVRVSWMQAMAFCRRLSEKTKLHFTLPTEAQWEYACRAGSAGAMSYGGVGGKFSDHGNFADKSLAQPAGPTGGLRSNITGYPVKGILLSAVFGGNILCDVRFDDGAIATADVGGYRPNAWGLYDMHGNVAEWTRTTYRPYPCDERDGRDAAGPDGRKVVRGGSWRDRPKRCRSAFRLSYPSWQRVFNVGFRVVCEGRR